MILAFGMVFRSRRIVTLLLCVTLVVAMVVLVSVYYTRGSENPDSRSPFSESEIVARQPGADERLIFAF